MASEEGVAMARTELRWLIANSQLVGLRLDGSPMSWDQALRLYAADLKDWVDQHADYSQRSIDEPARDARNA